MVKKKNKMIMAKKRKKTTTYKIKFIDSYRFMSSSRSNLNDNLSRINDKECQACMEGKKIKSEWDFIGFKLPMQRMWKKML